MCIRDRYMGLVEMNMEAQTTFEAQAEYAPDEIVAFEIVALNRKNYHNCRIITSICGGICAGVLGLTGLSGFFFYFLTFFISSAFLMFRVNWDPTKYFHSAREVILSEVTSHILSFLLFWVLFHNLVNVF
eukprot:TRINITY_DN4391_c0_g1_i4.p1 TRINITY_DN4391_c0_g1~~TRINITY_DN4391_c0_g1_i4.p1  ORF type:complete len:130 (+),score=18.39 TRINITY_DN4391_c0_g1_i4:155-544(+)